MMGKIMEMFFLKGMLLVKSGPCKKTTTSASIWKGDMLIAHLMTNVRDKFLVGGHEIHCPNKGAYSPQTSCTNATVNFYWDVAYETMQKKMFSPQVSYLTLRHRLIAKKRKKKDYICKSYLRDLFNKANYHSVSNGIKLMSQRCYKELVPPTGVGSKGRCDWFKKLYPHQICACGESHTVWQELKATKPLPKQLAPFSMKVIMNASHLAAYSNLPGVAGQRNHHWIQYLNM